MVFSATSEKSMVVAFVVTPDIARLKLVGTTIAVPVGCCDEVVILMGFSKNTLYPPSAIMPPKSADRMNKP